MTEYRGSGAGFQLTGETGEKMRLAARKTVTTVLGVLLFALSASHSVAQVKKVQMKIGGYLCGN